MTCDIRVTIGTGERLTKEQVENITERAGDEAFWDCIESTKVQGGEYPEDGVPAMVVLKTDSDPVAMEIEAKHFFERAAREEMEMLPSMSNVVTASAEPDEDVIQRAMKQRQ